MFKNKVFLVMIVLGILGIIFYSLSGSESYFDTIKKQRDTFLKNLMSENDSPIASIKDFSGIKYFEADKNFIVDADFKAESAGQGMILMTDSTQTEIKKAGKATFSVDGKTFTVNVFDEGEYFLCPFRDLTSGKETYGGGRFVNIPKDKLKGENEDEMTGIAIVRRAAEEPLRQIIANAGEEGAVIVQKVKEGKDDFGYNARTDKFENLYKAGVIDPTKVTRIAIENAASIASMLLTTECVIADEPEENNGAAAMAGMGGGMPGMM
jgi:hypothetical protein